jgi:hypothetical protein
MPPYSDLMMYQRTGYPMLTRILRDGVVVLLETEGESCRDHKVSHYLTLHLPRFE